MPWTSNDKSRIIEYQAYSLEHQTVFNVSDRNNFVQAILDAMTDEALITVVQGKLTEMDTLDAALATELGSANYALIKADVLEWQPGNRTEGIKERFNDLRKEIAFILSKRLHPVMPVGMAGSGSKDGVMLF